MSGSGDYISREAAVELLSQPITMSMCLSVEECHHKIAQQRIDRYLVENIPAADAIEELLDFAHFVAKEVVVSDDEWDNRQNAFPEIASRKLNKLGIVEKDGAFWSYEPPKEAE